MLANYGYKNGSGEYFIIIDTEKCDGCGKCASACPSGVIFMTVNDYDETVPAVTEEHRKKIKYSCAPCKPVGQPGKEPCVNACEHGAIKHSW